MMFKRDSNAYLICFCSLYIILFSTCTTPNNDTVTLFELMDSKFTGVEFRNDVHEDLENNILSYTNFYNGGGVSVGDINNDGLVDIYLSANSNTGKLYLNKGGFRFQDITQGSGLDSIPGWKTGVTMVDINQDGFLDIYICRSGRTRPKLRSNLLYVNNGDQTFTEQGNSYGLDSWGTSVQATFFDYDLDNDLDMFLLNHAVDPTREIFKDFHDKDIDRYTGDKLFKNENGHFTEVNEFIGINRSKLGDGLGVAIGDLNNDGYPDIYVCNDFAGRDYLYFNNTDGTFSEKALQAMGHISYSSMGVDVADIDNDGWQDLFVLDMNSSTNYGRKTNMSSMNPEAFHILVELGGHHQYMRNTLQLNNGNESFSDIAPAAGVSSTDWSWAPLFIDFDNDGFKDLFVTNGMRKNTNNKDFESRRTERTKMELDKSNPDYESMVKDILDMIPPEKVVNLIFKNMGGLSFERRNEDWGINLPSFSNGAAYADFDNDGDMDLVINNIDQKAHIYQNHATRLIDNHFLKIKLQGSSSNLNGIGARVEVQWGNESQYMEQQVSRGFQSSVDFTLHFGLGQKTEVDKVKVTWPDGKVSELRNIAVDKTIQVDYANSGYPARSETANRLLFTDLTKAVDLNHRHLENSFDDFKREVLLPHKMSTYGPGLAVADINSDGLDDFYIGGAMGSEGAIYTQQSDNSFTKTYQHDIIRDKYHEDMDALFFDADEDGDLDLYVVSGGSEQPEGDTYYQDRLYLNNGKGGFERSRAALPPMNASGSVVRDGDMDQDGDLDLFVGGRLSPGKYPKPGRSYLLENENGQFKDVTASHTKDLQYPGMVTDALWSDYDNDGEEDLIVVGEWMPITVFRNLSGKLSKDQGVSGLGESDGWWFSISESERNKYGRMDYIVGNLGENYKYKARPGTPFRLFSNDFDNNGSLDIVLSYYQNDTLYPLRGKQCSSEQIPSLKKKFKDYNSFGLATLEDIYEAGSLATSDSYEANTFSSSLLINTLDGFDLKVLPSMAQISAVFGIVYDDFDKDGFKDIIIAGNLYNSEVETPRNDAGKGLFLKGDGSGGYVPIRGVRSGLFIPGDVKKLRAINLGRGPSARKGVIAAVNNGYVQLVATTDL